MSDKKYFTRMGDGEAVWMTKEEIREDVLAGVDDAVTKGKAEALTRRCGLHGGNSDHAEQECKCGKRTRRRNDL